MAKNTGPVTVYHPTLEGISYVVPAADAQRWADAGWRKTPLTKESEGA